ncbi:MAG: O-antigen ligase family protein [Acidobacteriaceae bacterium]|nr:O-antigen ligase family protein [Acidobacteriaceae bacterium]MBV9501241.1 O-antigen ligase family protein [Acidobacteriaceae bacterium]
MSSPNARPYLINPYSRLRLEAASPAAWVLDWSITGLLCLVLAFGPLAFGAVQEWATFVLEAGSAALVLLWAARQLVSRHTRFYRNPLFLPLVLFAALVCLQLLTGRTAYWYATWRMALLWAAYGMIFFVTTQCLRRTARVQAFALSFTAFGVLLALFAMVQQFTWNGKIYWVVPNRYGGWVYGPYVNHAHYAGMMEMLVPIPLVFALMSSWSKSCRVLFGFAALLMASTIFLSQSLGGIVAFAVEMAALGIFVGVKQRSRRQVVTLFLLAAVLAGLLVMLSPGGIAKRISRLHHPMGNNAGGDRLVIVKDSLRMIAARPVLGWGLGTFPVVYPSFRSFYTNYFVNATHNDYVQTTVETGVLGFGIVCLLVWSFYRTSIHGIGHWQREVKPAIVLASVVGVTGMLVHSLSDFNLQIPANAVFFFALAALGTANSSNSVANNSPR